MGCRVCFQGECEERAVALGLQFVTKQEALPPTRPQFLSPHKYSSPLFSSFLLLLKKFFYFILENN